MHAIYKRNQIIISYKIYLKDFLFEFLKNSYCYFLIRKLVLNIIAEEINIEKVIFSNIKYPCYEQKLINFTKSLIRLIEK